MMVKEMKLTGLRPPREEKYWAEKEEKLEERQRHGRETEELTALPGAV